MIRINLLPVRQVKKIQAGQRQLLIFLALVVVEVVAMLWMYISKSDEVDEKKRTTQRLQGEIAELKRQVGDFDVLAEQRKQLLAQRDIINQLQKGRTGPVWMMRELSDLLTARKGPNPDSVRLQIMQRTNPAGMYDSHWDTKRLWIDSFREVGGRLSLEGKAKDYSDVAEFAKRLNVSKYFTNNFNERNDQILDGTMKLKVVKFVIRSLITY